MLASNRQAAALCLLRRRAVRASMVEWAKETGVEPKRHHRLIIDLLEKVCAGELDRVMILAPPELVHDAAAPLTL